MIDCLDGLIGLTDIDCECVIEERPENYNSSSSGYFLTDPEWGIPFKTVAFASPDCFSGGTIWEVMQNSIDKAIIDFCTDLNASLYSKYDSRFKQFSGFMGQMDSNGTLSTSKQYAVQKVNFLNYSSGCFTVDKIALGLSCDAIVDVRIRDSQNPSVILHTIPSVEAKAGQFASFGLEEPIELPMQLDGCRAACYLFEYEIPDGCKPINNKITCCGKKPAWLSFAKITGFNTDDLGVINSAGKYAQGLLIGGFVGCRTLDWICEDIKVGDKGLSLMRTIAATIRMKAVVKLGNTIHNTGKINFTTLLDTDRLMGQIRKCNSGYSQNIQFICENLPVDMCDCLKCKPSKRVFKAGIMK